MEHKFIGLITTRQEKFLLCWPTCQSHFDLAVSCSLSLLPFLAWWMLAHCTTYFWSRSIPLGCMEKNFLFKTWELRLALGVILACAENVCSSWLYPTPSPNLFLVWAPRIKYQNRHTSAEYNQTKLILMYLQTSTLALLLDGDIKGSTFPESLLSKVIAKAMLQTPSLIHRALRSCLQETWLQAAIIFLKLFDPL